MSSVGEQSLNKVIRHKDFAERLQVACENNNDCPTEQARGKQKWLKDRLSDSDNNISVSPEAVRKWFAGESRPRVKLMTAIAQILDVDEAWLSLGKKPDQTQGERRVRNVMADGAVNFVIGLVQMSGGSVAFADGESREDFYAIIGGTKVNFEVKTAHSLGDDLYRFTIEDSSGRNLVIGVIPKVGKLIPTLISIPQLVVGKLGSRRGDFYDLTVSDMANVVKVNEIVLPRVADFRRLVEVR